MGGGVCSELDLMGGGVKRKSNSMGGGGKTKVPSKSPIYEPRCEKTGFLHMQKQRRRSASR